MQAVILAGGLGERLRPVTEKIPKPMVEAAGRPFLYHMLKMLSGYSIHEALILAGYRADVITEFLKQWEGMTVTASIEPTPLGTGGALKYAEKMIDDEFILLYGDSYLPINYDDLVREFRECGKLGMMVVYDNAVDTGVKNNVRVDEGLVSEYNKNAEGGGFGCVEAGVLAFTKNVLNLIPPGRAVSLEEEIFPKLIAARELASYVTAQRFYDIGTPERLKAFEEYIG